MADIGELKTLLDLYGVGVRAGVITPTPVDEEYFRGLIGIPAMTPEAVDDWDSTGNVRKPLTIKSAGEVAVDASIADSADDPDDPGDPDDPDDPPPTEEPQEDDDSNPTN